MMSRNLSVPYTSFHKFSVKLCKEQVEVVSKLGLPDWDVLSPSTQLLAEYPVIKPADFALLFGCHQSALVAYLSQKIPKGHLSIMDNNETALEMAQMTLSANDIPLGTINILTDMELPLELYQKFDLVLMQIPKGRFLTRRWLLQAYNALMIGGSLYIAGSNNAGIKSVIKDARDLFGSGSILAYRKGNRIAHFIRNEADLPQLDWARAPGIAPRTWVEFSVSLPDLSLQIRSLPGVFSFDRLDDGTEMLLSTLHIPPGVKVLDIGCGYGIIGFYAAANGAGQVHLVDNNLLAIASCKETMALNRIPNAQVFAGDLLEPVADHKYDLILSNPPFHTGHAVDYQIARAMIDQSHHALNPGGQLIIVSNRFIRYDHIIQEIFGNSSTLAESGKFHVLSGLKSR